MQGSLFSSKFYLFFFLSCWALTLLQMTDYNLSQLFFYERVASLPPLSKSSYQVIPLWPAENFIVFHLLLPADWRHSGLEWVFQRPKSCLRERSRSVPSMTLHLITTQAVEILHVLLCSTVRWIWKHVNVGKQFNDLHSKRRRVNCLTLLDQSKTCSILSRGVLRGWWARALATLLLRQAVDLEAPQTIIGSLSISPFLCLRQGTTQWCAFWRGCHE